MCGIAGIIGDYNDSEINSLVKKIKHRGPDGLKYYKENSFCFIHSLLKIMDLSNNSVQPMIDKKTGNVIIFNGSIYNYKELKRTIFSKEKFTSNTDTEVLLKLYDKFGLNLVEYINGMYSIALYIKKLNKIFLIKDKYGIKPLYYFANSKKFIFASEIKALVENKTVKENLSININEVVKFIGHRQIHGFKNTLLKNINNLEAGQILEFDINKKNFNIQNYSHNISESKKNKNYNTFEKNFDFIISQQSITEHKKIACFLSGGLDSTLLSIILKNQAQNKEIHTFSSILNNPNDENKNIPKLNKEFNFTEHYINEDVINFIDDHIKTVDDMDQPTADASMIVHNVLCREVAKNGFKVLFSGLGGDEIFYGYPIHIYGYLASVFKKKGLKEFFKSIKFLSDYTNDKYTYFRALKETINYKYLNYFKNYQLSKNTSHLDYDIKLKEIKYYEKFLDDDFENIVLNYNSHWGLSYFLDYEDKNSMSYGIESRVPYLDYNLVEYSKKTELNDHFELGPKSLLRSHTQVPNYVLNTKKKYGFPGNLEGYINKNLDKIKEIILYSFKDIPLINTNKLINLTKDLEKNKSVFFRTYSYGIWYKNIFK